VVPSRQIFDISYANKHLELGKSTAIMGILNVTPDSFSDGNLYYNDVALAVGRAKTMLKEGADIIDVGGESTRPGSKFVGAEEEAQRVIPVIKGMRSKLGNNFMISIDTYKADVARQALLAGADMVNSLSGFSFDRKMADVVAQFKCPIIIYHIKGRPKTMQKGEIRYKDVVDDISKFFKSQIAFAKQKGISKSQLLIDPGIGFGKSLEQNLEIVRKLGEFSSLKVPIVIGVSRKSHLGLLLKEQLGLDEIPGPSQRLAASLAETAIAVGHGAHIVRTHDVSQTKRFVVALDALYKDGK
jgi:dihydropteroate synthase